MSTMFLILWFAYWFLIWGIFNFILIPAGISFIHHATYTKLYFISASIPPILFLSLPSFLLLLAIEVILLLIPRYRRSLAAAAFIDVVFQQLMVMVLFYSPTVSSPLVFIISFFIAHLPLFLLQHLRLNGKLLIYLFTPLGGALMYLLYRDLSFPLNFAVNTLFHFNFYLLVINHRQQKKWGLLI